MQYNNYKNYKTSTSNNAENILNIIKKLVNEKQYRVTVIQKNARGKTIYNDLVTAESTNEVYEKIENKYTNLDKVIIYEELERREYL